MYRIYRLDAGFAEKIPKTVKIFSIGVSTEVKS